MKKKKLKSLVKSVRKAAEKDIRLTLITALTDIASTYGESTRKLKKDIKKSSVKVAKKLAKELNIDQTALTSPALENEATLSETAPPAETPTEG